MIKTISAIFVCFLIFFCICCIFPPLIQKSVRNDSELNLPAQYSSSDNTDVKTSEYIRCIDDNNEALILRLQMLETAQEEIIFSTFDFRTDYSGTDILVSLYNAAKRGVAIRFIADGLSNYFMVKFNKNFKAFSSLPNVTVKLYNPVSFLTPWKINYRMHDKYIIIDNSLYILGGRNTNDLFLGNYCNKQNHDRDILVYSENAEKSASIYQLRTYFEHVWNLKDSKIIKTKISEKKTEKIFKKFDLHYSYLNEKYPDAFNCTDRFTCTYKADNINLLTNPINAGNKEPTLWHTICNLMLKGKNILLQTPYIICNKFMYKGLAEVVNSSEKLCIVTNAVENGANPWGCSDYINQKNNITETGATVYEYLGEHSLHTKAVLIDDNLSIIGSFNLDMRSTYLDTELMLAVSCEKLNLTLRENSLPLIEQSNYVLPDGKEIPGPAYKTKKLTLLKNVIYSLLSTITKPIRHIL